MSVDLTAVLLDKALYLQRVRALADALLAGGLRFRCDVCGQPASRWTVARGLDTAHCRRCDALHRDLERHAETLFRLPDARSWRSEPLIQCSTCFEPLPALRVGLACPRCGTRLPCASTAARCNRRLPGDPTP